MKAHKQVDLGKELNIQLYNQVRKQLNIQLWNQLNNQKDLS